MSASTGSRTFTERLSKTEDARTVPVPGPVMDALQEHLAVYCGGAGREGFLFLIRGKSPAAGQLRPRRAPPGTGASGSRRPPRRLDDASAHRGSLMFDAGLTLFEVQQRLGHKSPTLTAEIYTHLMRERFDEGRSKLEEYMAVRRLDRR